MKKMEKQVISKWLKRTADVEVPGLEKTPVENFSSFCTRDDEPATWSLNYLCATQYKSCIYIPVFSNTTG